MDTEGRNKWIHHDLIYLCDGYGYGLLDTGRTFCIGKEAEIRTILNGEEGDRNVTTRLALAGVRADGVLGLDQRPDDGTEGARPTVYRREQSKKAVPKRQRTSFPRGNGKQPSADKAD